MIFIIYPLNRVILIADNVRARREPRMDADFLLLRIQRILQIRLLGIAIVTHIPVIFNRNHLEHAVRLDLIIIVQQIDIAEGTAANFLPDPPVAPQRLIVHQTLHLCVFQRHPLSLPCFFYIISYNIISVGHLSVFFHEKRHRTRRCLSLSRKSEAVRTAPPASDYFTVTVLPVLS